jgi:molybdopterin-guanine dinucleotide biosynthesis protein A
VATFPCDAPFLPTDLVARLRAAVADAGADMACAASEGRSHPVVGLWPVARRAELHQALVAEGLRKVDAWTARYRLATVDFAPVSTPGGPVDPFFNTNHPEDLAAAERLLASGV